MKMLRKSHQHANFVTPMFFLLFTFSLQAQQYEWKCVNLQGMGYVTGMVVHPDTLLAPNLLYVRTDVGGAYRLDAAAQSWVPLLDFAPFSQKGYMNVESMALDPSDPDIVYAAVDGTNGGGGEILFSDDRGQHWQTTAMAANGIYVAGNDPYRGSSGERLMVDPNNTSILYFGSRKDGLWRKEGVGAWNKVADSLPATTENPGFTFVVFDKNSMADGKSQRIYAGCFGSGVWMTEDAGTSWKNISGGINCLRASLGNDGTLYVTYGGDEQSYSGPGKVACYRHGSWTEITPPSGTGVSYSGICADPYDTTSVVVTTHQRSMYYSRNRGTSWVKINPKFTYYPAYYNAGINSFNWGTAALVIDPNNPRRLWSTNGYGVIKTEDYSASTSSWTAVMKNLEEICLMQICTPPLPSGADLLTCVMDMVGFRHQSRDTVPSRKIAVFPYVAMGVSMDYCFTKPNHVVFLGLDETNANSYRGYSTDNGRSWTSFSGTPGKGGKIAVSATNENNWVWVPDGETVQPQYTLDAGKSWLPCSGIKGPWHMSTWGIMHYLASDKVNGNRFYYCNNGKMFYSSDGGANWTAGSASLPGWPHGIILKAHPSHEGELWLTIIPNQGQSKQKIFVSKDGGKKFTVLNTVGYAYTVAFGKGAVDSIPYVYMCGKVGSMEEGIYKSVDAGKTWTLITDPSSYKFTENIEADMRYKDLVYAGGAGCRGIFYGFPKGGTIEVRQNHPVETIEVFPNPGSEFLNISASSEILSLRILNLAGREILRMEPQTDQVILPVNKLSAGTYLLEAETAKGRGTVQFIKK